MYCEDCHEILYPIDTSNYAAHSVVRFRCANKNCSNNEEIYLNHCLNGQCNNIIDSRISRKCENGLYICNNCGSCCSHDMLKRHLENLELTGGYVHQNLRNCVKKKLGHLERAIYFCYRCKSEMKEINNEVFKCDCGVTYYTEKYKFKRPHKYLAKNDLPYNENEISEGD